jgi:hypothetical protein
VIDAPELATVEGTAEAQPQADPLPARRWVVVRRRAKDRPEGAEDDVKEAEGETTAPEGETTAPEGEAKAPEGEAKAGESAPVTMPNPGVPEVVPQGS